MSKDLIQDLSNCPFEVSIHLSIEFSTEVLLASLSPSSVKGFVQGSLVPTISYFVPDLEGPIGVLCAPQQNLWNSATSKGLNFVNLLSFLYIDRLVLAGRYSPHVYSQDRNF